MSPVLLRRIVQQLLIDRHPLPWRIEIDWSIEVYDARDALVIKCMNADEANELLELGEQIVAENRRGDAAIEKLLSD